MKLSKVYSSDPRFKTVQFHDGLNVILASSVDPSNTDLDLHSLGKSMLITLIDFLLIGKCDADHVFRSHSEFSDHVFFLEIKLNSGRYATIRRSVSSPTVIDIKVHEDPYQNFTGETEWDYQGLRYGSKQPDRSAISVVQSLLGLDVTTRHGFRKSISYFLRGQNDYHDEFQLSKFKGRHDDWKPFMFELLGLDPAPLEQKYSIEGKIKDLGTQRDSLSSALNIDISQSDRLKTEIQAKTEELRSIRTKLDSFSFTDTERSLVEQLVSEIEEEVSNLNTKQYELECEIKAIEQSLRRKIQFDLKAISKVFEDCQVYFPDQLRHDYEQLLHFHHEITKERNEYLSQSLANKLLLLDDTRHRLETLDAERQRRLEWLTDTDSLEKYRHYQSLTQQLQGEIETLEAKLQLIAAIREVDSEAASHRSSLDALVSAVQESIDKSSPTYDTIKRLFNRISRSVLDRPGLIYVELNKQRNPEFRAVIEEESDSDATALSEGFSYRKMQCAFFDLSLLVAYSDRSFYRFVFHDGVLDALDHRKAINYLAQVRSLCNEHGLQYITTAIKHHLPRHPDGTPYELRDTDVVLELTDDPSGSGTLFGFRF